MSINNPAGGSFTAKGAWNGFAKYSPFDCVTNGGVGFCNYVGVPASAAGTPVSDGSGNTVGGVSLTTIATTLVTGGSPDLLCAVILIEGGVTTTSIADTASNTWTLRTRQTGSNNTTEVWTAPASAPFNGTITATLSGNTGGNSSATMVAFGIGNYNTGTPFDPNAGLPFHNTGTGALSVSTTYALDFLLWVSSNAQSAGAQGVPPGFTTIANLGNNHGLQNSVLVVAYELTSGTLSGASIQGTGGSSANVNIVDAVQGATAASNPAPASDPGHWIG